LFEKKSPTLTVVSFLDHNLEEELHDLFQEQNSFDYTKAPLDFDSLPIEDVVSPSFCRHIPLDRADIVLLPMPEKKLEQLKHFADNLTRQHNHMMNCWSWLPLAVIAVLPDDSIQDAITAAQLDFDGILARPFKKQHLSYIFQSAMERSKRKNHLAQRYEKLQHLFRQANRNRHYLRDKVDLLCKDLVQSNVKLAGTLQGLRKAYNFQSDLTGEFDLRLMLNKALCQIKGSISDANAAMYLTDSNLFEAHIVGSWYDQANHVKSLENTFKKALIPQVMARQDIVFVQDNYPWDDISPEQKKILADLAILAVPVKYEQQTLGIIVIYRHRQNPFTQEDHTAIIPLLTPFARAIEALNRLENLLVK